MIVHRIARRRPCRQWLEILLRSLQGPLNARIDVVALLKVYVLKQIAADRSRGNRTAVHLDTLHMRNRTLNGHKSLAQVFINTRRHVGCGHGKGSKQDESRVHQASSLRWDARSVSLLVKATSLTAYFTPQSESHFLSA